MRSLPYLWQSLACLRLLLVALSMWAMVAFIRSLPELDESQYTMLTTRIDGDMMDMSFDGDMNMSDGGDMGMNMSDDGSGMQH